LSFVDITTSLNNQLTSITGDISTLQTSISSKQNIIDENNKLLIENVDLGESNLSFVNITTNLQEQLDSKQTVINDSDNKLPISNVDLTGSSLTHVNITSNLQEQLDSKQTIINNSDNKLPIENVDLGESSLSFVNISTNLQEQLDSKQNIINDTDNKLPISNIELGESSLSFVDISTSLNTQLTNITSDISTLENSISLKQPIINDTDNKLPISNVDLGETSLSFVDITTSLNTQLTNITGDISTLESSISSKQNIIDENNKLAIENVDLGETSLSFVNITSNLQEQLDSKQAVINNNDNKLPIENVDLTGSSLTHVNITSNLQEQLDSKQNIIDENNKLSVENIIFDVASSISLQDKLNGITDAISSLEGLQNGDITSFTEINSELERLETSINLKQNIIDENNKLSIENIMFDVVSSISLEDKLTGIADAISSLEGLQDGDTTSFPAINSELERLETDKQNTINSTNLLSSEFISINETDTLDNKLTNITSDISTLENSISLKQPIINDTDNKLPISNVDLTGSSLSFVDITTSLNTQLTNISGDISTLESSITLKQNIIDENNKLLIENVDLGESSLSFVNITSNLQEQLDSKQNVINDSDNKLPISNVDLTGSSLTHVNITSNLQEQLDSKQTIINDTNKLPIENVDLTGSSLTHVNITSNLQDQLDSKQHIINDTNKLLIENVDLTGSSLSFVDISTSLNAQLTNITGDISTLENSISLKQNIIDDTDNKLPISNVDLTGSSLSFVNISSNLQEQLDSKQSVINDTDNKLPISNVDLTGSSLSFVNITSNLQDQLIDINDRIDGMTTTSISSINYESSTLTTTISGITAVETLKFNDNSEQMTAFTYDVSNQITKNTDDILTKNDIINGTNKLSIDFINLGTNPLRYVDAGVTQNLSITFDSLAGSILALQASDVSQSNVLINLTNSLGEKQNIIDDTNLLTSEYVSYHSSNVQTELDSINTSMSGKVDSSTLENYAPLNDPIFTGTVSGITKGMVGLGNVDDTSDINKPLSTATIDALSSKANIDNPTFTGTVSGITKGMVGLSNVDNTSDSNKPISTATDLALSSKANVNNSIFTGYIQTPRIFEMISTSIASFSLNKLTYNYSNGSILFFDGLTSNTDFELILMNVNPNNETNRSFTFSLIIHTQTHKACVKTFVLGSTTYPLIASGGLSNLSVNTSAVSVIQSFTIVYTTSPSAPYQVFTSLSSYF